MHYYTHSDAHMKPFQNARDYVKTLLTHLSGEPYVLDVIQQRHGKLDKLDWRIWALVTGVIPPPPPYSGTDDGVIPPPPPYSGTDDGVIHHLLHGLNIGLFQFSSQISVTLVSVLFTPPLVNPIYQQLSR